MIAAPGRRLSSPSTISDSPSLMPWVTIQLLRQLPCSLSVTCWAVPSRATNAVSVPSAERLVARCGTGTARIVPSVICTRRNWPGRISPSGLSNCNRIGTVPVVGDTAMPGLTLRPAPWYSSPVSSVSRACTSALLTSRPALTCARLRRIRALDSETST